MFFEKELPNLSCLGDELVRRSRILVIDDERPELLDDLKVRTSLLIMFRIYPPIKST